MWVMKRIINKLYKFYRTWYIINQDEKILEKINNLVGCENKYNMWYKEFINTQNFMHKYLMYLTTNGKSKIFGDWAIWDNVFYKKLREVKEENKIFYLYNLITKEYKDIKEAENDIKFI